MADKDKHDLKTSSKRPFTFSTKISDDLVTRPDSTCFVYHSTMWDTETYSEERLCHYFGLDDAKFLRYLRICRPVLVFWATFYQTLLGGTEFKHPEFHDICLMWSLFQSYNLPIDEFEAQLSAASFEAGDDFISRATNTARVLILFKKCLRNSIQPSFVAPGLELVAEKWREFYASTASDCGMDPTIFEVPDLPYDTLQKIRLIAPARYKEHPFEQYQRLFILLKHTEANLHPRKWFTENYDPLNRRFRSENWTFSPSDFLNPPPGRLTARDQPLAAPLWMRGELYFQYLKSTHSLELDAIKLLQKYRHEAMQPDVAASDLQEDGEDTVDIASQSNVVTSELQDLELQEDGEETVYEGSQEDGEDTVFIDDHTDDNGMIWALPRD